MSDQAISLDDHINEADKLHVQAEAIVDLISRSKGMDLDDRTIANASWCLTNLLDALRVERRAVETFRKTSMESVQLQPQPYPHDGTGAHLPWECRREKFIDFPECIAEAEVRHRTSGKHGLEFAGVVFSRYGMTYAEAVAVCAMLRIGGNNDWRIPTLQEMRQLRHKADCKADGTCFWTSTPPDENPEAMAMTINTDHEGIYYELPCEKVSGCFLLPVRSISGKAVTP